MKTTFCERIISHEKTLNVPIHFFDPLYLLSTSTIVSNFSLRKLQKKTNHSRRSRSRNYANHCIARETIVLFLNCPWKTGRTCRSSCHKLWYESVSQRNRWNHARRTHGFLAPPRYSAFVNDTRGSRIRPHGSYVSGKGAEQKTKNRRTKGRRDKDTGKLIREAFDRRKVGQETISPFHR